MKFGLQRMLAVGFAAIVLTVGFIGVSNFRHFAEERRNFAWANHTDDVIKQLDATLVTCVSSQSAVRGFAITGDESYLSAHNDALRQLPEELQAIANLTADNPTQQKLIAELRTATSTLLERQRELVRVVREAGPTAARALIAGGRGQQIMAEVNATLSAMRAEEQRLRPIRWRAAELGAAEAQWVATAFIALTLVLLTACYGLVRRLLATRQSRERALRSFAATLDQRVRERTAELENTHAALQRALDDMEQSEAARRAADARFRALVEQASDAMYVHDAQGQILDVNPCACTALGYSAEQLLGLNMAQICASNLEAVCGTWNAIEPGKPVTITAEHRRANGTTFPVEIRVGRHDAGEQRWFIELARDITERKEAERIQAQLAAIVQSSPDAIVSVDRQLCFATWNQAAERLLGYPAEEIVGRPVLSVLAPEREWEARMLVEHLSTGRPIEPYETVRRHKDGRLIPVAATAFPIRDSAGRVIGGSGILRDISDRRRLEAELLRVSDHEQQRLGHDLHDGIGQQLTAIELVLFQLAATTADPARREQLDRLGESLRAVVTDVRALARGLAPFILDADGLQSALAAVVASAGGTAVHCTLACPAALPAIEKKAAAQLYRIAQEAFNNALKHSGASSIEIRLIEQSTHLRLEIADNGRGFPVAENARSGLGLQIMRYRAALMGADFNLVSRAGGGTTITCLLPLGP